MARTWEFIKIGLSEMRDIFPRLPEKPKKAKEEKWRPSSEAIALVVLFVLLAGYAVGIASTFSRAYVDLGDGNYLYTASRMADGLAIYKDFLSPQPPMHMVVGSWLIRLGRLWGEPVYAARAFSLLMRLLSALWVYLIARRVTQSAWGGVIGSAIFLALPIGLWWSMGYQSEHQEVFWLLGALVFFLTHRPLPMAIAGAMTALAVLTNMTAAPYAVACLVYLVVRCRWRLLLCFFVPLGGLLALIVGYYQISTGAYFENVISNQVGSYPKGDMFWPYVWHKLTSQGGKVLALEGGWIALSLLGLAIYNRTDARREREFFVWYALVLLLSIVYATKGGTMDYIFVIGEPMVAVFASAFLVSFFYPSTFRRFFRESIWRDSSIVPQILFIALLGVVVIGPGLRFIVPTLRQETFEQTEAGFERVEYLIDRYSKPGDRILAPPYYAFATGRLLVEEYSELYLWTMKYRNEREAGESGLGVYKVLAIRDALRARRVPIVIADSGGALLMGVPEIKQAVEKFYKPALGEDKDFRTLNFRIRVYIPKTDADLKAEKADKAAEKR